MIGQTAEVESLSPMNKEQVRIIVSPDGIESAIPEEIVVSFPIVEPNAKQMESPAAIMGAFCHAIFFFPSEEEAAQWISHRDNIETLPLIDAHRFFLKLWSHVLPYV